MIEKAVFIILCILFLVVSEPEAHELSPFRLNFLFLRISFNLYLVFANYLDWRKWIYLLSLLSGKYTIFEQPLITIMGEMLTLKDQCNQKCVQPTWKTCIQHALYHIHACTSKELSQPLSEKIYKKSISKCIYEYRSV